jgi:hypothetical protein
MKKLFLFLSVVLGGSPAFAHDARPVYVQIQETESGVFNVQWNAPPSLPPRALPTPSLPTSCQAQGDPVLRQTSVAYVAERKYRCSEGLSGQQLGIRFPSINPSLTTLFQVQLSSGERHFRVLKPGDYDWTVPDAEEPLAVAKQYTWLGIEHIWIGVDHLLFVACLLFIARTPRRVLITITGFTVAHSLTLALSALELVRVPVPPVEAVIALSVVFLAVEIARGNEISLTFRYPIAVSSSFGLLHGFGFASVLREIGLPQTELPVALLFFNIGVEIGQILFVGLLIVGYLALRKGVAAAAGPDARYLDLHPSKVTLAASYVIGGVASFWMMQRIVGFWA